MRMMRRSEEREKELSTWELANINSRVKEVIRKVEEEVSLINNHDIILQGKYYFFTSARIWDMVLLQIKVGKMSSLDAPRWWTRRTW